MKTKYSLLFLIVVFSALISCKKQEPENPFVIQIEDKRIELILEDNAEFLIYNTPTKAEFIFENIELNTWWVKGRGIRMVDFKNIDSLVFKSITEINYSSEKSISDTLEIELKFRGINDTEYSQGIIKVPVKTNHD